MRSLECSSAGDKRFSAFYATVEVYGVRDSIENHYQLSKRFKGERAYTWRGAKGRVPTTFFIGPSEYPATCKKPFDFLTAWYKLLWMEYLDNNPKLVDFLLGYERFTDRFSGKSIICQADAISQYILVGRWSIIEEIKPLVSYKS
ncbi:hypothetical protein D3C81_987410 [compost metagenome]